MSAVGSSNAQIFPDLEGEELVVALREEFKPAVLLTDAQARDTLYAKVFLNEDSVRCIYSGLARELPAEVDPSQFLFGDGIDVSSLNLEHAWPQSKGAGKGTKGNVNMHHLYPSRVEINSDRSDFPYSEIEDTVSDKWYYLHYEMSSVPSQNIDHYSEFSAGIFEPREIIKGDIARAMFYFWTIYRDDAIQADPDFFEFMFPFLCTWHSNDPVDGFELMRNERIASYQGGKINPFISDCSLVRRAYCTQLESCVTSTPNHDAGEVQIVFDPLQKRFRISSETKRNYTARVYSTNGTCIFRSSMVSDEWSHSLDVSSGLYFIALPGFTVKSFYIP